VAFALSGKHENGGVGDAVSGFWANRMMKKPCNLKIAKIGY
jgi:hypothetical protein